MHSPALAPRSRANVARGILAASLAAVSLTACGGGSGSESAGATKASASSSSPAGESSGASAATSSGSNGTDAAPFSITHDWVGHMPPNKVFTADDPQILTEDQCLNGTKPGQAPWSDVDGKRAPVAQENPLVIYADGRCNSPLSDPTVGFYEHPTQASKGIKIPSGTALGVECYVVTTGGPPNETIQDIRGASSRSPVWIGAVLVQANQEIAGFIPDVNAGYLNAAAQIGRQC